MSEHFSVAQAAATLDAQRDVLKHIRTQAAVIASFSFLVARFLAPANESGEITLSLPVDYCAAVLFLVSIFFASGAALLSPQWFFFLTRDQALQFIEMEKNKDEDFVNTVKTELLFGYAHENSRKIASANTKLSVAMIAGTLQTLFWLL